jgi:sulfate/thiosulfate-binding protein
MKRTALSVVAAIAIVGATSVFAGAASAQTVRHSGSINLVGYSTPGLVYGTTSTSGTLEYAFAHTSAGAGVSFSNSFAASDAQAAAVINGQHADVVNFSYAVNMTSLVAHKLVAKNWFKNAYNGDVTRSVVAFGVRSGNPKNIHGWADLTKSGVGIVTPSAALSGSAKWNILGAYSYASKGGKKPKAGVAFLTNFKKNIIDEPSSGSKSVAAFLAGTGDVVIGYQDDLLLAAKANPGKITVITPAQSFLIENPLAATKAPASQNPGAAKAFVSFLYSKTAQSIWAQNYYWPVLRSVYKQYKSNWVTPKTIYTVKQLGGWNTANPKFFEVPNGIWTKIENGG